MGKDRATPMETRLLYIGVGISLLLLVLLIVVWLSADGTPMDWVFFYVLVALLTGVLFWTVTPGSTGEVTVQQLGIRLGGGAAIGAAFMLLAHWLTPAPPPPASDVALVSLNLPDSVRTSPVLKVANFDEASFSHEPVLLPCAGTKRQALVQFKEGASEGWFRVSAVVPPGKRISVEYTVSRGGEAQQSEPVEETIE